MTNKHPFLALLLAICSFSLSAVNKDDFNRIKYLVENEQWAKNVVTGLKDNLQPYLQENSDWLSSRLCMYWNTCATDVYIDGEFYSHAGGETAPVPTVMFTGARGHATKYKKPSLSEITPYNEDSRGMYLQNTQLVGQHFEWASISQTGRIIESINNEILGKARDAAFLYWLTGEKRYGDIAAKVMNTYLLGLYYRNVPIDLNHGHQQTLVGMTSFEVIHEDAISTALQLYDFMRGYINLYLNENKEKYQEAFKKCADNIIEHGVPHNNWDLIQARYIMDIAMVLNDNHTYNDGKGRQHYVDIVLNKSSLRQWSLKNLAEYGFDSNTGVWGECPGYSMGVIGDFSSFAMLFDTYTDINLIKEIPVIDKAVSVLPQYLFPNGNIVGFGDTHPSGLNTGAIANMIRHVQHIGDKSKEQYYTSLYRLFSKGGGVSQTLSMPISVSSFFATSPLTLDSTIVAAKINDLVTPTFYAPNVSWLVQRNGMDSQNSLMISLNGSLGNHMHANGISMELYGKGYTLAPDAGIGKSLYQGIDYQEYYSQFPAHNTVCVDGISSYPVMKSNHAFKVKSLFPRSQEKIGYQTVSYSEVYFTEPESGAEQMRLNSIIATTDTTGYYVDIFRSHKTDSSDKFHDYFYHNLGQDMLMTSLNGDSISFEDTEELSFAGGHLYAYSYIYNQKGVLDVEGKQTKFTINRDNGDNVMMTMWSRGDVNRRTFKALSPMTEGLSRTPNMPYDISSQPTLTFVSRQYGEAWNHPFAAVFEPSTTSHPGKIKNVEFPVSNNGTLVIKVTIENGITDLIISNDNPNQIVKYNDIEFSGSYAVARYNNGGKLRELFLGNLSRFKSGKMEIESSTHDDIHLTNTNDVWTIDDNIDSKTIKLHGLKH